MACSSRIEKAAFAKGFSRIAGLDEAGRGCLFGPVYAAAVILDPLHPVRGLNDSKQLTPEQRNVLAPRIRERAIAWSVAYVEADVIDRINIYQASRLCMKLALEQLDPQPDYLLVDALTLDSSIQQESLIKGDARSQSIAAASILAKTARDEAMVQWDARFPEYGLAGHKGYPTRQHVEALQKFGVTAYHRRSYAPVQAVLSPPATQVPLLFE